MNNMKPTNVLIIVLLGIICSCNQNKLEHRILGKWLKTEISESGSLHLFELILEEDKNWMSINYKGMSIEYTVLGKYEINGDSIIFFKDDKRWDWCKIMKCDEQYLVIQNSKANRYERE